MRYARQRGIKGFVIDACLRDSAEASDFEDFGVYARGVQCNGQKAANAGFINGPVSVGGIVVFPGDIIRGDADGVVVIPKSIAADVIDKCEAFAKKDLLKNKACADGTVDRSWVSAYFKDYDFVEDTWENSCPQD